MRFEIALLLITAGCMWYTYTGASYVKIIAKHRKSIELAFIAFAALTIYVVFKYNPTRAKNMLLCANNVVRYMPINRQSADMFSSIVDFSGASPARSGFMAGMNSAFNPTAAASPAKSQFDGAAAELPVSTKHRRSVSETRKKYTASSQNWRCAHCGRQLDHTFEVDHKVRLEYGGDNDQLQALCRNCHGIKTASENMRRG